MAAEEQTKTGVQGGNSGGSPTKFTSSRRERRKLMEMSRWNGGGGPWVVVRQSGSGTAGISMDMGEVQACRDLGLDLPRDWTVEIPSPTFSADSPVFLSTAGNKLNKNGRLFSQIVTRMMISGFDGFSFFFLQGIMRRK